MANMANFGIFITLDGSSEVEIEALKGFTAGLIKDQFAALLPVDNCKSDDEIRKLWGCQGAFDEIVTWEERKLDYSGQCKWSPPIGWAQAIATNHPKWNIKIEFASWESGYRGSMEWDGEKWNEEYEDNICMACNQPGCHYDCMPNLKKGVQTDG